MRLLGDRSHPEGTALQAAQIALRSEHLGVHLVIGRMRVALSSMHVAIECTGVAGLRIDVAAARIQLAGPHISSTRGDLRVPRGGMDATRLAIRKPRARIHLPSPLIRVVPLGIRSERRGIDLAPITIVFAVALTPPARAIDSPLSLNNRSADRRFVPPRRATSPPPPPLLITNRDTGIHESDMQPALHRLLAPGPDGEADQDCRTPIVPLYRTGRNEWSSEAA
jgi:hypothetical protein